MDFVAFYLPQYHPVAENDAVYGPGFTEWDNVRRAHPLFPGHYQPHQPHSMIGWYNLLDKSFLTTQHRLAYQSGVKAFCYYYYNFAGHTILEEPLKLIRANANIQNSYCLCWAHPGWYDNRRGPGAVFVQQNYDPTLSPILFRSLLPYFEDPRYITISDCPLLLIWAPERHPTIRVTADILREESLRHGFPGLCLAGVEAYGPVHPASLGLDCMVEFAPNWLRENHVSAPGERPVRIDYTRTLSFMLHKEVPPYLRMRCTFPAWDNTPRRGADGIACVNISPAAFEYALDHLVQYTRKILPPSHHYVFINAWNEWGEGCHLEPDVRYGVKYLQIVKKIYDAYSEHQPMQTLNSGLS